MRVKQDSGSSHSVLNSWAGSWTQGCLTPQTSLSSVPASVSGPSKQPGRVSTREERDLKEEGGLLSYPPLLHPPYEEDGGEMPPPLLKTSFLGSLSLFQCGESPLLVQLGMLCDLTGAAGADAFVEGSACTHTMQTGPAPASLLITNI